MAKRECVLCEFGELQNGERCLTCRGTGFVRVTDAEALPIKLQADVSGFLKGASKAQATHLRCSPGLRLKDKHGDTFIVADLPHQKGLKGSEVAAWMQDETERPSPMVVFAEDVEVIP